MAKIIISEFMDENALVDLRANHEVIYDPDLVDDRPRLIQTVKGATALIVRNRTQVDRSLLDAAPELSCVGRLGVGLDNIDLQGCAELGVKVYPATGANDASVAEYVIAMALILLRNAFALNKEMIAGNWPRQQAIGGEIAGKTLGLIGYGSIARETAKRAKAMGMDVLGHDPHLPANSDVWGDTVRLELAELLEQADVVSLHVPLNAETRHLVDVKALKKMKNSAVLINAARGGVVDEIALAAALKIGEISGAALDVFETEPLDAGHGSRFAGLENIVLTPHIAGVTDESNVRVSALTVQQVAEHLSA